MSSNLKIIPTILLSEIYYPYLNFEGEFARIIEDVAKENFYRAVEVGTIHSASERSQIKSTVETSGIVLTSWMTDLITEEGLDLSSSNKQKRTESVKRIVDSLYFPTELGAENVALISGLNHGKEVEKESLEAFYESLMEISSAALKSNLKVLVEPLDKVAHKKRFIGSSEDLFEIVRKVKKSNDNIGIAFDTAHAALNEENIEGSLEIVNPFLEQLHFSNAVLDSSHKLYGDHHIPIGTPGFMTELRIMEIVQKLISLNAQNEKHLRVSIEMRSPVVKDIYSNVKLARELMDNILNYVS